MDILVAANLKFAIDHNRKTTRMRTERIPVPKWNQYFILRLQLFSEDDNDIPLGANNTLWTPSRMVQYDFTRRKNCHILYSVMFYKKYDAIFTCGTPIMSCTTVHPTQEIHTWKKITSHSPHHNVQVDIYIKIPGPCRRIPRQPTEETSARMTFRNIFPFKNERGPLWLDLLCKSKTILHKSKLKFTWTFRKSEREKKKLSIICLF